MAIDLPDLERDKPTSAFEFLIPLESSHLRDLTSMAEQTSFELLISKEEIRQKIACVAKLLNEQYKERQLTIIMVMKGAFCLVSDLIKELNMPCVIEAVTASSYGERGTKRGDLTLKGIEEIDLQGKDILVIDDVFDSGATMSAIVSQLQEKRPRSLQSLVLLAKKVEHKVNYYPDYVLFEIENQFVVGYGLDYKELYRNLPSIYVLHFPKGAEN